jgi:hypothetical protein
MSVQCPSQGCTVPLSVVVAPEGYMHYATVAGWHSEVVW